MSQTNVSLSENTTEAVFSMHNVLWVTAGRVAGDAAIAIVTLVLAFFAGAWQLYTMAGVVWALVIVGFVGIGLIWRGRRKLGVWLIIGGLPVTLVGVVFLISGAGLLLAAIMLALTSMAATQTLPETEAREAIVISVIGGIGVVLLDLYGPAYRLATPDVLQNVMSIVAAILILAYGISIARQFGSYSLRTKLIVAFLLISLLAVSAVAFLANRSTNDALTKNVGGNLKQLTDSKALNIGDLMLRQLDALRSLSLSRELRDRLILANTSYGVDPEKIQARINELDRQWVIAESDSDFVIQRRLNNAIATELQVFRNAFPDHVEVFVTDIHGGILAATNRTTDFYQADEEWWQAAYNNERGATYISLPTFDESSNTLGLNIAIPVYDNDNKTVLGILRSTYRLAALGDIIASIESTQSGLRADLLFPDGRIVSSEEVMLKPIEPIVLDHLEELAAEPYKEFIFEGVPTFASQAPVTSFTNDPVIANLGWIFIIHQNRQEALAAVDSQGRNIILLAVVIASVAVIAAVGMAQLLTRPITRLTNMAEQVVGGDLATRVEINTGDEIGALAASFNSMIDQLLNTIDSLEERVAERTQQLEIVVEVSQRLSSILDLSDLVREVVSLTKERFNYYHVHIYLLDDTRETLIMTEGYGEAGAEMKRQRHSIPMTAPQSLVARAAREGRVVTVENVRANPTWLPNSLLPNTHSEMAVPVHLDGEVVGVLDVQHEDIGGLTEEDETTLQVLANQLANAIRNAHLFSETQEALIQTRKLQQVYTGQAWEKYTTVKRKTNYEVRRPTLPPLEEIATPEAEAVLQQGKTVNRLSNDDTDGMEGASDKVENTLATPLKLGDKIIGILGIRDENLERQWTEDEIALIEAVSEQMSLALENARLVEETRRNAWRDRVVSESTAKVWSSAEIEEVMRAAVAQLGDTLGASEVVIRLGTKDYLEQS